MTTILASWRRPGQVAIDAAWQSRAAGSDLLTTLEDGLAAGEVDPELIAIGCGSVPNSEGKLELDASIMDGRDLRAGAVCAVQDIMPAIRVARLVMERTGHVMLAGRDAEQFALENGFERRDLMTENSRERYGEWVTTRPDIAAYVHASEDKMGDTITVLGLEDGGHCAAASSTSGLPFKRPGRVGDSPIIGAGIYADDEVGCAGSTGNGEALWRSAAAMRTVAAMERGLSATEACEETIRHLVRRQPYALQLPVVAMALRKDGDFGAACFAGPFELWVCHDGEMRLHEFAPIHP
jgi:N4-(beta-N-acetylglucosaminyl)-L-asparaginase